MHFKCPECRSRGKIYSRNEISPELSDLYYSCSNPDCGHRWLAHLSFGHTITPPHGQLQQMLLDYVRQLPESERRALLDRTARPA